MKRPYDLVSFMQQEERAELLNILKDEMSNKKFDETVDHVVEQTSFDQVRILQWLRIKFLLDWLILYSWPLLIRGFVVIVNLKISNNCQ